MSSSTTPWHRFRARRVVTVAAVGALALAGIVGPSAATGSSSASVSVTASVNGVVGAPAFTAESGTVGLIVTNKSLTKLAGYVVVVPKGIGTVTSLGVSNSGWSQTKTSCGLVSNCSALYIVAAKTSGAQLPQGSSVTSSFGIVPPTAGTATFRLLGIGSNYSGLVVVGAQPTITIVDGAATALLVSIAPPVVAGQPSNVTVSSVREYPAGSGTYTPKPFPAALSFGVAYGAAPTIGALPPAITTLTEVTVPITFPSVQVSPQQVLTATSGSITGSATFDVVAAGVVSSDTVITLTGAGGTTYVAQLPNGANGPVSFTEVPCTAVDADCDTEVNLNGKFKTDDGTPLYTNAHPAGIDWVCPASECAYVAPSSGYGSNPQEQWVDFSHYSIQVSLKKADGSYTPFAPAGFCNPQVSDPSGGVHGQITDPTAQAAGFCVDVYAISRAGGSFSGDLTIPVLFVEDPKLRGI